MNSSVRCSAPIGNDLQSGSPSPSVTIVICTRNRLGHLRECLESLRKLDPAADEVLVVDNTTGLPEVRETAEQFGARYTVEPVQGLSRARNRGIRESRCEIIAYLDDDATPDPHWLRELLQPFADPVVAATTGKVLTPAMDASAAAAEQPRFVNNKTPQWFEIATFGGLGLGSNMALRRAVCEGERMFDERLGRGAPFRIAEENYAFARLLAGGHTVAFAPSAVVFHPPLNWGGLEQEVRNSMTYALLLFAEFPQQRGDLMHFLVRRLRRKSLTWPRNPQEPGQVINSGWGVRLRAGLSALFLFLRTRKPRAD